MAIWTAHNRGWLYNTTSCVVHRWSLHSTYMYRYMYLYMYMYQYNIVQQWSYILWYYIIICNFTAVLYCTDTCTCTDTLTIHTHYTHYVFIILLLCNNYVVSLSLLLSYLVVWSCIMWEYEECRVSFNGHYNLLWKTLFHLLLPFS